MASGETASGKSPDKRLHLVKLLEPEPADLAAIARLLIAAERRLEFIIGRLVLWTIVEIYAASADTTSNPIGLFDRVR